MQHHADGDDFCVVRFSAFAAAVERAGAFSSRDYKPPFATNSHQSLVILSCAAAAAVPPAAAAASAPLS